MHHKRYTLHRAAGVTDTNTNTGSVTQRLAVLDQGRLL
jgi:hypothetical protein